MVHASLKWKCKRLFPPERKPCSMFRLLGVYTIHVQYVLHGCQKPVNQIQCRRPLYLYTYSMVESLRGQEGGRWKGYIKASFVIQYSKDEKQLEAENRVHRFNQGLSCCLIFFIFFCKHFSVTPCWMEFLKRATREIRLRLQQNERIALFTIFNWTQERFAFFSQKTGDLRKNPKNCWALLKSDDIESLFQKERRERFAWKPKEILCSFKNIDES